MRLECRPLITKIECERQSCVCCWAPLTPLSLNPCAWRTSGTIIQVQPHYPKQPYIQGWFDQFESHFLTSPGKGKLTFTRLSFNLYWGCWGRSWGFAETGYRSIRKSSFWPGYSVFIKTGSHHASQENDPSENVPSGIDSSCSNRHQEP